MHCFGDFILELGYLCSQTYFLRVFDPQNATSIRKSQYINHILGQTSSSAMAEGLRDALVSRNSATTKHPIRKLEFQVYRVALFA